MKFRVCSAIVSLVSGVLFPQTSAGITTTFFDLSQTFVLVSTNDTSDTISSDGYLFTHSLDKWWYPGISIGPGTPTGRYLRVAWPSGVEAQAITAASYGVVTNQIGAKLTLKRVDGLPFDLATFTCKLLANTAGAGASFEVMPKLQGEDALNDPLYFNASGYAGQLFAYSSPTLKGYDAYDIALYVDFALIGTTLVDPSLPPPELVVTQVSASEIQLRWPADYTNYVLQATQDLQLTPFQSIGAEPVSWEGFWSVTLPVTNAQSFFRLGK